MSLLIVGTIAFDSVETPWDKAERVLGGSGTFAGISAGYFCPPRLVGVIGGDFPEEHLELLRARGIDTSGVERSKGKTFFWAGKYEEDVNIRTTTATELNVLENFNPALPDKFRDSRYLFLANIDPELQISVLDQCDSVGFSVIDTMNFWIEKKRESLDAVLQRVDAVLINDEEARMLCGTSNLLKASRKILEGRPKVVIVKKGAHGITMMTKQSVFSLPGYPLERVFDPTGAGDSFAGGFIGFLAGADRVDEETLRQAVVAGSATASFCCESFSIDRFKSLTHKELSDRIESFERLVHFNSLELKSK